MDPDILSLRREPLDYTEDQKTALAKTADFLGDPGRRLFVLAGYAGTGKTPILENIAGFIRRQKKEFLPTAPTNRAVRVLAEKLPGSGGRTLHSLLYGAPDETGNWVPRAEFTDRQVLVCDEASMVSASVHDDLLNSVTAAGAKLLYIGDSFQLPPVEGGGVLAKPDVTMRQVVRQSKDSDILSLATAVRALQTKIFPSASDSDVSVATPRAALMSFFMDLKNDRDCVYLCGKNETRAEVNRRARAMLFGSVPSTLPQAGDRLVCIANGPLPNGETLTVEEVKWPEPVTAKIVTGAGNNIRKVPAWLVMINRKKFLFVPEYLAPSLNHGQIIADSTNFGKEWCTYNPASRRRELDRVGVNIATYAYALTAHKSQGGQWDSVYVDQDAFGDDPHWFYTAITRAVNRLILIRKENSACRELSWEEIRSIAAQNRA